MVETMMGYSLDRHKPLSSKSFLLISFIIFILIAVDGVFTSLPFYDIRTQRLIEIAVFFVLQVCLFCVYQILLLKFVNNETKRTSFYSTKFVKFAFVSTLGIQCIIISLLAATTVEILALNMYHSFLVITAMLLSASLSVVLLSLLSAMFVRWVSRRPYYLTAAYTGAAILLVANSATLSIFIGFEMKSSPEIISYSRMSIATSHIGHIELMEIQSHVALVSFVSLWAASSLLLARTVTAKNRLKFYIVFTIPLLYYLGFFDFAISLLVSTFDLLSASQVFDLTVASSTLTRPIGGAMFGIAFWVTGSKLDDKKIRQFMMFAAIGIILLTLSNEGEDVYLLPYPPFGFGSISFIGISSYLLLIGLYYSAALTSIDSKIRAAIEGSMHRQLSFLSNIGLSQMESQIEDRVKALTKALSTEVKAEGISTSLTDDEIRTHIEFVIKERESALLALGKKARQTLLYQIGERPCEKEWDKWVELWWRWCYSSPPESNPVLDIDGRKCSENQQFGDAWFLAGTFGGKAMRRCKIPRNRSLFFPIINDIISFATDPQLKTVDELCSYAKADINAVRLLSVKIDGFELDGLDKYRVSSYPFEISVPLEPGGTILKPTTAVSDGYWVFMKPLTPGEHLIEIQGEKLDFDNLKPALDAEKNAPLFRIEVTYHLVIE